MHAAWVESRALRRAGISRDTPNPGGRRIVHGADGAQGLTQRGIRGCPARCDPRSEPLRVDPGGWRGDDFPPPAMLNQLAREGQLGKSSTKTASDRLTSPEWVRRFLRLALDGPLPRWRNW